MRVITSDLSRLEFFYDSEHTAQPTPADTVILSRARAYLIDDEHWLRSEVGDIPGVSCPALGGRRSLLCALRDAAVATEGEFYWGRQAVTEVRDAILRRAPDRYRHALTGFNSDSTTALHDVQTVFWEALARIRRSLGRPAPN